MSEPVSDDGGGGDRASQHHDTPNNNNNNRDGHVSSNASSPADEVAETKDSEGRPAGHVATPHDAMTDRNAEAHATADAVVEEEVEAKATVPVRTARFIPTRGLLTPTLRAPLRLRRPRRMEMPLRMNRTGNAANGGSSSYAHSSNVSASGSARESLRRQSTRAAGHYTNSNHYHYYHGTHNHRVTPRTSTLPTTPSGVNNMNSGRNGGGEGSTLTSPRDMTRMPGSPEPTSTTTAAAVLTQHTVPLRRAGDNVSARTATVPSQEAHTAVQVPSQPPQYVLPQAVERRSRAHPRPSANSPGAPSHRGITTAGAAGLAADLGLGRNADARVYLNTNVMHVHRGARRWARRWATASPVSTTTITVTHGSAAATAADAVDRVGATPRVTRPSTTTLSSRPAAGTSEEAAATAVHSPSHSRHRSSLVGFSAHDETSVMEPNANVYPTPGLFSPSCVSLPGLLSSCTTPAPAPLQSAAEMRSPGSEMTPITTPAMAGSRATMTRHSPVMVTSAVGSGSAIVSQRVTSPPAGSDLATSPTIDAAATHLAGAAPGVADTTPRDVDEVEERALLLPWESCSNSALFRPVASGQIATGPHASAELSVTRHRASPGEDAEDVTATSHPSMRGTPFDETSESGRAAAAAVAVASHGLPSSPYLHTGSMAEQAAPSLSESRPREVPDAASAKAGQQEKTPRRLSVLPGAIAHVVTTTTGHANANTNNNVTTSFSATTQKLGVSGSSPLLSSQTSGLSSSAHSVQISTIEDAISAVTRTPLTNAQSGSGTQGFAASAQTTPGAVPGTALFGFFGMLERATCFQEFAVLRRLYDVELRPFLEQVTEHIFAIEGHSSVARVHNHLMQLFFTARENEKVGEEFYSDPTNSWPLHVLYLICCFYITASRCGYGRLYAAMQRSGGLLTLGKGMFAALAVAMAPRAEDLPRTTANMYLAAFYVGALMRRQQRRLEPALEDVTQRYFALLLVNIPVFTLRQLVEQVNSGRCGGLFTNTTTTTSNTSSNAVHEAAGATGPAASSSLGRSTTSIATNTTTTVTSPLSTTMPHSEIEVSRIISSRSAIVCGHPLDLLRLDIVLTRYADFNGIKIHKDYLPATAPENSGYYNRSMVLDLLAFWHTKGITFCPNQLHLRLFSPCNGEVWSAGAFGDGRANTSKRCAATGTATHECSGGGGAARFARCVAEAATYRNQDLTYSLHHLRDRDVLLDFSMHALSVGPLIAWANKEITILSVPTNRREGSVLPPPRRSAQDSAMLGTLYKLSVINDILHQVPVRMRPCPETPIGGVELSTTFEQLGLLRVVKAATASPERDDQPQSTNDANTTSAQDADKERNTAQEQHAHCAAAHHDVPSSHGADGLVAHAGQPNAMRDALDLSLHTPPQSEVASPDADAEEDPRHTPHDTREKGDNDINHKACEGSAVEQSMYRSSSAQSQRQMATTMTSAETDGEEEASPLSGIVPRHSQAQSALPEPFASIANDSATTISVTPPTSQSDKLLSGSLSTTVTTSTLPSSHPTSSDWISLMSGPHSTSNVAAVVAAVAGAARLYAARSHHRGDTTTTTVGTAQPSSSATTSAAVVPVTTTSSTSVASADLNDAAASLLLLHGGAPLPHAAAMTAHDAAASTSSTSSSLYARGEAAAGTSGRGGTSEMFLCSEDYVIQRNPHFADVINVFKVSETIKYYEMQFGCVLREGALRFATLLKERTGMDFPLYMLLMCPNVFTLLEMWDGYIFIERWCNECEECH